MKKKHKLCVLVTGGAGYIGSHMAKMLCRDNHEVVIFDNLSTGNKESLNYGTFVKGDLTNIEDVENLFQDFKFDVVIHFAAFSIVSESVANPAKYFRNNVISLLNLLDTMLKFSTRNIIFSSTAALYGEPQYLPIDENHVIRPINPYGESKAICEKILENYCDAYSFNAISLRYFNACGADLDCELGERHNPETHLIPLVLHAGIGKKESIKVFGHDYPTKDGTCIRDYVHVIDICSAHKIAMHNLIDQNIKGFDNFNVGGSSGYSVNEVIKVAREILNRDGFEIKVEVEQRRLGDPAVLIASSEKLEKLGWKREFSDLETIISSSWEFEKKFYRPN